MDDEALRHARSFLLHNGKKGANAATTDVEALVEVFTQDWVAYRQGSSLYEKVSHLPPSWQKESVRDIRFIAEDSDTVHFAFGNEDGDTRLFEAFVAEHYPDLLYDEDENGKVTLSIKNMARHYDTSDTCVRLWAVREAKKTGAITLFREPDDDETEQEEMLRDDLRDGDALGFSSHGDWDSDKEVTVRVEDLTPNPLSLYDERGLLMSWNLPDEFTYRKAN